MPRESLDELRLFSNLDFDRTPPFTLILAGQPPLREPLAEAELVSLDQRLPLRASLSPLTDRETVDYLDRRLRAAGAQATLFRPGAADKIFEKCRGVLREINNLATGALVGCRHGEQETRRRARSRRRCLRPGERLMAVLTAPATLHASELVNRTAPISWLVEGLFLNAGAGILGGAPKSCKSFFALDLCVAIASGTSCAGTLPGRSCQGPSLLLCAEDPDAVISQRLIAALTRARGRELGELPIEVLVEPVRLPDGLGPSGGHARGLQTDACSLLDPLIRLHRADENSASEMSVILDGLRKLARSIEDGHPARAPHT